MPVRPVGLSFLGLMPVGFGVTEEDGGYNYPIYHITRGGILGGAYVIGRLGRDVVAAWLTEGDPHRLMLARVKP
jgi:hypothetical protein